MNEKSLQEVIYEIENFLGENYSFLAVTCSAAKLKYRRLARAKSLQNGAS